MLKGDNGRPMYGYTHAIKHVNVDPGTLVRSFGTSESFPVFPSTGHFCISVRFGVE